MKVINYISCAICTLLLVFGIVMAIPASRNYVLDRVAEHSEIYKKATADDAKKSETKEDVKVATEDAVVTAVA